MSSAAPGTTEGASLPIDLSVAHVTAPVSTLAFWVAIALPMLYLPLFLAGIDSTTDLGLFLGLFGLHIVALLLGHAHGAAEP